MFGASRRIEAMAQRALDVSASTNAAQLAHEARCTERWSEAKAVWDRVERTVDMLTKAAASQAVLSARGESKWMAPALAAMGAVTMALFTAVGVLSYHLLVPH